jgi:hypothetical protein
LDNPPINLIDDSMDDELHDLGDTERERPGPARRAAFEKVDGRVWVASACSRCAKAVG